MPNESPVRAALAALLVAPPASEPALAENLAELGFEVWLERGSDQACRRAAAGPDLVLVDLEIARAEGWALPRFLAYDLSSRVPVVVFGPEGLEESAREVLEDLCVTYLPRSVWASGVEALGRVLLPLMACARRCVLLLDRPGAERASPWARALSTAGFDLRSAGSAIEALQALEERRPEILIVRDVPSVVGADPFDGALARLVGQLQLVILADRERPERRARWLAQGAVAYLVEPLHERALLEVLLEAPAPRLDAALRRDPPAGLVYLELDPRGLIADANSAAGRLFGRRPADLIGRGLAPLVAAADRPLLTQPLDARARRRPERLRLRLRAPGAAPWALRFDVLATAGGGRALIGAAEQRFGPSGALDLAGLVERAEEGLLWIEWPGARLVAALGPVERLLGKRPELGQSLAQALGAPLARRLEPLLPAASEGWPGRVSLEPDLPAASAVVARVFPLGPPDAHGGPRAVGVLLGAQDRPRHGAASLSELLLGSQVLLFHLDQRGQLEVRGGVGPGAQRGGHGGSVFSAFGDVPALVEALRQGLAGRPRQLTVDLAGRTFEVSLEPELDESGQLLRLNGAAVDASQRRHSEQQLKLVVEATSSASGQGFFRTLVRYLTRALSVRLAYVAELVSDTPPRLSMLALWSGSEYSGGYEYEAEGTPDALVLTDGAVHFPEGLYGRFRRHAWIAEQGVTSYLGVPILDSKAQGIGVLGVLHVAPLDERVQAESILRIFAARAGFEIERQRQSLAVRGSEARWRSLVENAPDLIATLDSEGRVLFANRQFSPAPGGGPPDFYSQILPEDRGRIRAQVEAVFASGAAASAEYRMRRGPDRITWHACRIGRHEEEGRSAAVILVATDITPRKEAQAKLELRVQLEKLITSISTRFINLSSAELDEGIQRALQQISEFTGLERAFLFQFEADGTRLVRTHGWSAPGLPEFQSEIREEHPGALGWLLRRLRAREDFFVRSVADLDASYTRERMQLEALGCRSFLCVPLSCAGDLIGFLGFDRLRSELPWDPEMPSLMRLLADVFANTVARARSEARRALLEERLRQAQKLESLGTLAGGVAHDFNNLLMAISGHAELLLGRPQLESAVKSSVDVILKAARRGSDLTRQLLGCARSEKPATRVIDLHASIAEVHQLLARTLNKNIQVELELAPGACLIRGDAGQLQQVLLNLAVNARDAMPHGGRLTIRTGERWLRPEVAHLYPELPSGRYQEVLVADTGVGMSAELQARIFEPFFTTKEPGRGTGMGLAMVYGIVRSAGGIVRVRSEPGQGAEFSLLFPAVGAASEPEPIEPASEPISGSGTVLVVDDEALVRSTAAAMVEELGYRVLTAEGGSEAVQRVAEAQPPIDLVLLDLIMPGMDGRATFTELRKLDPDLPIVLSSGWGYDNIQQEFPAAGLSGLVRKPFQLAELSRVLKSALERRGG